MIREDGNPHNSRPFDVHTWSDHPEVNDFLDDVFNLLPDDFESKSNRKGTPTKRVLKVLLLDLFCGVEGRPSQVDWYQPVPHGL